MLSKGKSTAALSLAWFSSVAAQNLVFKTAALCSRPQFLFSYSKERNAGFNFYQFFCPSFALYTREERGDVGGKPRPPYFFRFIQYKNSLRTMVVSFRAFLERTLLSLTSAEVQWQHQCLPRGQNQTQTFFIPMLVCSSG